MSLNILFILSLAVCASNAVPHVSRAPTAEQVSETANALQNLVTALDGKDLENAAHLGVDIIVDPDLFLPVVKLALDLYNAGDTYSISCYTDVALQYGLLDSVFVGIDLWILLVDDIDRYTSIYVQCYTQGGTVENPTEAEIERCKTDISALFSGRAQQKASWINSVLEDVIPGFPILALCLVIPT